LNSVSQVSFAARATGGATAENLAFLSEAIDVLLDQIQKGNSLPTPFERDGGQLVFICYIRYETNREFSIFYLLVHCSEEEGDVGRVWRATVALNPEVENFLVAAITMVDPKVFPVSPFYLFLQIIFGVTTRGNSVS
jgi:hypothetical protein